MWIPCFNCPSWSHLHKCILDTKPLWKRCAAFGSRVNRRLPTVHGSALLGPTQWLIRMLLRLSETGSGFKCVPKEKQFPPPPITNSSFSFGRKTLLWLCSINGHSRCCWKRKGDFEHTGLHMVHRTTNECRQEQIENIETSNPWGVLLYYSCPATNLQFSDFLMREHVFVLPES